MRSQVTRIALRGATRLLTTSTLKSNIVPAGKSTTTRLVCTSTASISNIPATASNTGPNGSESSNTGSGASNPGAASSSTATTQTQIMPNDGIPSETPAISTMSEMDTEFEPDTDVTPLNRNRTSLPSDPATLADQLNQMIQRNAVRTAMWHFASALAVPDSPAVDKRVARIMLPVLGRNAWSKTANDTIDLCLQREYDLGIGTYNCGLHALSRSGNHQVILEILDKMWALPKDSHPNATTYNYLIGSHIYRGALDDAFGVLNQMKDRLIYPTFSTYHSLITGCLRRREPRRAYATLLAVQKLRFDVSAMTVAQVLVSSAQNDDFDHVVELLDNFDDCLPRYSKEIERIAESRQLYKMNIAPKTSIEERSTLRGEPRLELGAISSVLHCAFRGGRTDIATRAWALIERFYPNQPIPAPMWYCLIGAYAGSGDLNKAFDTLATMRERGVRSNLKDLEVALIRPLAFDVAKIDEQFFRLVDRYEGKEVSAAGNSVLEHDENASTVTTMEGETATIESGDGSPEDLASEINDNEQQVSQAMSANESDDGKASSDLAASLDMSTVSASDTGTAPDISHDDTTDKITGSLGDILLEAREPVAGLDDINTLKPTTVGIDELNCIIAACSVANDLDRAFQTYDEIESRFGLERNVETFNALLEGCVQTRHLRGGVRVLQEMDNLGLERSNETIHLTCRLYLRAGRLSEALNELYKAREAGRNLGMPTYHMIIRQCLKGGREEEGKELARKLLDEGVPKRLVTGRMDFATVKQLEELLGISTGKGQNQTVNVTEEGMKMNVGIDEDEIHTEVNTSAQVERHDNISEKQATK